MIYQIEEERFEKQKVYIDGSHPWGMPGVHCFECNEVWVGSGVEYPSIDLSTIREKRFFETPRVESLAEFQRLKTTVLDYFPTLPKLGPGTVFGPFSGTIKGVANDFVWHNPWSLMIRSDCLKRLESSRIHLPHTVSAILDWKTKHHDKPELLEFEIGYHGRLLNSFYRENEPKGCEVCGRDNSSAPERPEVSLDYLPKDVDLFRLSNFPTYVMCTEAFEHTVRELGLKGCSFKKVRLI